jgi:predicted transcriptional regulator
VPRVNKNGERPQPILSVLRSCFLTNKDLAQAVGYSASYCSLANRGKIKPSDEYMRRCSEYLEGAATSLLFDFAEGFDAELS